MLSGWDLFSSDLGDRPIFRSWGYTQHVRELAVAYTYVPTYVRAYMHTYRHRHIQTYIHTDRQTDRETDRQTDRQD